MDPGHRSQVIEQRLRERLGAEHVDVWDDSGRHIGHAGANGGGHFRLRVVSSRFEGRSRLQSQRLVYEALGDLMVSDIHALQMQTLTPAEWRRATMA